MDTGYWVGDGGRIQGPHGDTGYYIANNKVNDRYGQMQWFVLPSGNFHTPSGSSQFFLRADGRIERPARTLPWL